MKLINKNIISAQPGDVLRDSFVPGLHLRAFANRKSYYLYFKTKYKIERRPKIGDHGIISLPQARDIAKGILAEVAAGRDPIADRNKKASAPDVNWLCDMYMTNHGNAKKTKKNDQHLINNYIKPNLGRKKVADIEFKDVDALHKSKANAPYQANRILALLSKMFNLAILWQAREQGTNPCVLVNKFREHKRRRHMSTKEAVEINKALMHYKSKYPGGVLFIYLLILSSARKSEIAKAAPSQVMGNRLFDLCDNKTGDDRPIYLAGPVLDLIKEIPANAKTLTGIKNPKKLWVLVREKAGCPDLRMHDLRRSFASASLSLGYSLSQIGELLRHRSPNTTAGYAYLDEDLENQAAEETAKRIVDVMAGKATFAKDSVT